MMCPTLDIAITTIYKPYVCGQKLGHMSMVVTDNRKLWDLTQSNDYVPINTEFNFLWETPGFDKNSNFSMLGLQVDMSHL